MRHIQQYILLLLLGITPLAPVASWAGPVQDEALRDAAGCSAGRLDIDGVKAALKAGADPNALSNTAGQFSPLQCVTLPLTGSRGDDDLKRRTVEIAKVLFAAGAKLGLADREILFFPISSGSLELVRLLIDKGASPTAKLEGFTPAELARKYDQLAVYDYLISRGGIPVDRTSAAQIVLIEAARNGEIAAMERAIKEGARINGTDVVKMTALGAALYYPIYKDSLVAAIGWLLDQGADPNQEIVDWGLPLHLFINSNVYTMAERSRRPDDKAMAEETLARLLKAGAKVSGRDKQGRTPLHVAAKTDNVLAAEYLIALGAKVMARDEAGKTPLDYAESGPMIELLKASGATER